MRLASSSCRRYHINVWVRPTAKEGITTAPPRLATRLIASASASATEPEGWSRSPYVVSHSRKSAREGGVGSFRIGWSYRPTSPENTITVCLPFSVMVNSSQQEPRMCPASCVRTENSGLIVNESERGISLNWFSAACASGVEYKGRGLAWLLYFFFVAYFASSSCRCAESSSNN